MKELEERKQTLNDKIVIAQYGESQRLMKQEIVEYLTHSLRQESRFLLHILVKSIIVYDDKIEIYFNFTERKIPTIRTIPIVGIIITLIVRTSYQCVHHAKRQALGWHH